MSDMGAPRYVICGTFSGIAYVLASQPMKIMHQTIKSLPKSTQRAAYNDMRLLIATMLQGIQKMVSLEGPKGLVKGMGTRFLLLVPCFTASFTGYGIGLHLFAGDEHPHGKLTYKQIFYAGCFSSVISTPIITPCERIKEIVIKTRYRSKRYYTGSMDCTVHWFKRLTLRKLFRNSWLTLLRDIPSQGVFFLSYEYMIDLKKAGRDSDTTIFTTMVAGGLSGALHKLVQTPFLAVRHALNRDSTRKYRYRSAQILSDVYSGQGKRGLFHGLVGVLMTGVPGTAGCFLGFEWCRMVLEYWWPLEPDEPVK